MEARAVHDRPSLERHLRRNVFLHLYSIGDLDDFFRPMTRWYATGHPDEATNEKTYACYDAVALLYVGQQPPTLLALTDDPGPMRELLSELSTSLPPVFYAHLTPTVEDALTRRYSLSGGALHFKMGLKTHDYDHSGFAGHRHRDTDRHRTVVKLGPDDADELSALYAAGYPGNWFDPRMLESGTYRGMRENGKLIGAGGTHCYSSRYRVAAVGNIATLPAFRGQGIGEQITRAICEGLCGSVDHIGLNVRCDNVSAVSVYRRVGFDSVATYREYTARAGLTRHDRPDFVDSPVA